MESEVNLTVITAAQTHMSHCNYSTIFTEMGDVYTDGSHMKWGEKYSNPLQVKVLNSESYLSRYILTLKYQQTLQGSWSSRKWEYVHGGLRQSAHGMGGATGSYRDKANLLLLFTISMRFACVSIPFKDDSFGNRTMITHNTLLHMSSAS